MRCLKIIGMANLAIALLVAHCPAAHTFADTTDSKLAQADKAKDATKAAPAADADADAANKKADPNKTADPVTPAKATPTTKDKNIRFQFEDLPYGQVLKMFSQMTGKPLISDSKIEGTLTFVDPKPYTYGEALDTLNIILSMKGLVLVETGRYLRLSPIEDLPKMQLKILKGLDQTGDTRPGEVVTVVLHLKFLDAGEIAQAVTPMISKAGSIAPLSRGRSLVITDRLETIKRIESLLKQMDSESPVQRQMTTHTIVHSSGSVVADLINKTFGVTTAPRRTKPNAKTGVPEVLPPHPDDYVTSVFDEASSTLVLFGPADRIKLAQDLIERFESKDGARAGEVTIYYPRLVKAEQLAQMIRQAIPGVASEDENLSAASTKARLIVDSELNRLIVSTPIASQLEAIEKMIARVDRIEGGDGTGPGVVSQRVIVTKVFKIRVADPAIVAKIVTEAMSRTDRGGKTKSSVQVTVDTATRHLVVSGSPGDVQAAVDIVAQIDADPRDGKPRRMSIIELTDSAEAQRLAPVVEQLYQDQLGPAAADQAKAKIVAADNAARLIVMGSAEDIESIEAIVKQLRAKNQQPQKRELKVIELKSIKIADALETIQKLLDERMAEPAMKQLAKPMLLADENNNRLLATGNQQQLQILEQIITTLDVAPADPVRQMRTVMIKSRSSDRLIKTAMSLLADLHPRKRTEEEKPQIIVAANGKQLIVLATADDHEHLAKIIKQLDAIEPIAPVRLLRSIQVHHQTAAKLSEMATELYQQQVKALDAPPNGGPATIIADVPGNRLIVSGPEAEVARVEQIVGQLDPADGMGRKIETRVVRLRVSKADDLVGLVQKSLNPDDQPGKVRILVDSASNSLVVTGQTESVQAAMKMIEQLDTIPARQPRQLNIIELKSGNAIQIAPMVTDLLTQMMQDKHGPNYKLQSRIIADENANRLIVTGTQQELDQINALVAQLGEAGGPTGGARVFQLKVANAKQVAQVITKAMIEYDDNNEPMQKITASADDATNTIVVTGKPADLQAVALIIEELDRGPGPLKERSLRILQVPDADVQTLATTVQQIWTKQRQGLKGADQVSITAEPKSNRLMIIAPPDQIEQVEKLVLTLMPTPQEKSQLHLIDLQGREAGKILSTLTQVYQEQNQGSKQKQARIIRDSTGQRLIVMGTRAQATEVERIIAALSPKGIAAKQSRVFDLGRGRHFQRVVQLTQQLYDVEWLDKPGDGQKARFVADEASGKLIVSGHPAHLDAIDVLIKRAQQLHQPQAARQSRVFDLGKGDKYSHRMRLIQQLYELEYKNHQDKGAERATFVQDGATGRLIVSATADQIQVVDAIVKGVQQRQLLPEIPRQTRIFNFDSKQQAERIRPIVEQLYFEWIKNDHNAEPADAVFLNDDVNARLIVSALPKHLLEIERIITTLQTRRQAGQARETRIYDLKSATAPELAGTISQLYHEQIKDTPGVDPLKVLILPDVATNRLVVMAPADQHAIIEPLIKKLDEVTMRTANTRIFRLKTADVDQVVSILSQALVDISSSGTKTPLVSVGADAATNTLVVSGEPKDLQSAAVIIEQLDKVNPDAGDKRALKIITLKNNSASAVAAIVSQVFSRQIESKVPQQKLMITALPDDRSLLLRADARTLAGVNELIDTLDTEKTQLDIEVRTYRFTEGDVSELAATLSRLFEEEDNGAAKIKPRFESNPATGHLIIAAGANQFERIEKLLKDMQASAQVDNEIVVFGLQHGDPAELAAILQTMLNKDADNPTVKAMASPEMDLLFVQAPPEQMKLARALITQLDRSDPGDNTSIQLIRLKKAVAESLATAVNNVIEASDKNSSMRRVTVTPEINSNTLLIQGPPDAVLHVMKVVQELDTQSEGGGGVDVRIYRLENGKVKEISQVLQEMLDGIGSHRNTPAPPLTISVDERTRSLIVSTTASQFAVIEQLIASLDKAPEHSDRTIQYLWLENAKAQQIATQIDTMFTDQPEADRPVVEADTFSNSLTIIAKRSHLAQIEKMVIELDEAALDTSLQVRVVPTMSVPARQVAEMIGKVYPQMSGRPINIVDRLNAQTPAPGTPKSKSESPKQSQPRPSKDKAGQKNAPAKNGVKDAPGATNKGAENKGIGARSSDAKKSMPPVTIAVDETANVLLISGSARDLDRIVKLIGELSRAFVGGQAEFRRYQLVEADPVAVAKTIDELFNEKPIVTTESGVTRKEYPKRRLAAIAEPRTRSVIVRALASDFAMIESLVKQLDAKEEGTGLQMRMFKLEHANPSKVQPLVEQMLKQLKAIRPGEPLQVTADPRTRSLVVIARGPLFEQIEKVIKQLDAPPAFAEAEVRILQLKRADAALLASVINEMLKPSGKEQVTEEAQALQEQVRRLKIRGSDGKLISHLDLTKPIKITADPLQTGGQGSNALLISSTPDNVEALAQLIQLMDKVPLTENISLRFVQLMHADASATAATLTDLFAQGRKSLAGRPGTSTEGKAEPDDLLGKGLVNPLNVAADAPTNTIVLSGREETLDLALQVIKSLDVPGTTGTAVKMIVLKNAKGAQVKEMIDTLYSGPSAQKMRDSDKPVITVDPRVNALFIVASEKTFRVVENIVKQVDEAEDSAAMGNVKLFPLRNANATQVAQTVRDLYKSQTPDDKGPPMAVGVDERINALVVSASEANMRRMENLIRQLDTQTLTHVSEVRIFSLDNADASDLQKLLSDLLTNDSSVGADDNSKRQTLLQFAGTDDQGRLQVLRALKERIIITANARTNSLAVSAPLEYMPMLAKMIKSFDQTSPREAQIRLFALKNADAQQMAEVLTQVFRLQNVTPQNSRTIRYTLVASDQNGDKTGDGADGFPSSATIGADEQHALTVTVDRRTNSMIIGGTPEYTDLCKQIIERLDGKPAQQRITHVYRLKYAQAANVVTALQGFLTQEREAISQSLGQDKLGAAQRLLEREVALMAEPTTNHLLVSASPNFFETIDELIQKLDSPQPQVLIQVLLAEVRLEEGTDLGMEFNYATDVGDGLLEVASNFALRQAASQFGGLGVSVTGGDFEFYIRALQSQGKLEVLSRPQILASDNLPATINIGQRVPFITNTRITEQGNTINTIQYEQVGIGLEVTARMTEEGFVQMEVAPQISSIDDSTIQVSETVNAIVINNRSAQTTVTVRDGQTIVIGGLITKRDSIQEKQLPILGDLPLLGWLFKSRTKSQVRTELLIVLTPHILKTPQQIKEATDREWKRFQDTRNFSQDEVRKAMKLPVDGDPPSKGKPRSKMQEGAGIFSKP